MRIGIDAKYLSRRRTGIGNYVRGLVELLPEAAPQHEYFLYSNRRIDPGFVEGRYRRQSDPAFRWCPGSFWAVGRGAYLARRDRLDVYWASDPILPFRMPCGVLKVITVHDLVFLRCPETMTRYNLLVQTACARRAIAEADCIVVVSRSTQDELIQRLGVPRERTRLVYNGVADRYRPQDQAKAAEYISRKYGVPPRYLATVGIVHPRKNQQFLARVLGILKKNGKLDCPLLVVGPMGWKNSPLFREIQAAGLSENDIRFLGYIPDEDMPLFYAGAQVFLFPTVYEGFGLPPVEAMACGVPVIASDAPCMPEVLGDAAILEPLASAERFADSVLKVLADGEMRGHLRAKGILRARGFRYETSVKDYPTPDGTCLRDYIHVMDIAAAHLAALQVPDRPSFSAYNIGTGTSYSVRQVCGAVERELGRKVAVKAGPRRHGDPAILCASPQRLMQELGWRPRFSDLQTIVRTAWKWKEKHPRGYRGRDPGPLVLLRS